MKSIGQPIYIWQLRNGAKTRCLWPRRAAEAHCWQQNYMLKLIAFICLTYAGIKAVQCVCVTWHVHMSVFLTLIGRTSSILVSYARWAVGGAEYSTNFVYTDVHQVSQWRHNSPLTRTAHRILLRVPQWSTVDIRENRRTQINHPQLVMWRQLKIISCHRYFMIKQLARFPFVLKTLHLKCKP